MNCSTAAGAARAAGSTRPIAGSHADNVPGHIHWVVQPVAAAEDPGRRGPQLQAAMFEAGELPDPAAMEDAADRLRAVLAGDRG